jgi:hypothetical protein
MALGINRMQVVDGANPIAHRLRLTFWIIYAHERMCSLYTGRPSALRDDLNDAPYPEDLSLQGNLEGSLSGKHMEPATKCGFIRAMTNIGLIADRIFVDIYSPKSMLTISSVARVREIIRETSYELESITHTLPEYLHFFDNRLPLGQGWQEVQRMTLGNHYYFSRMLMHRPALVFATFFASKEEAEDRAAGTMNIDASIEETICSAKSIISLNHDVYFRRYPEAKFDSSSATFLVSACITLLYDVLDPKTTPDYAKDIFAVVERAVECLDQIQHVGPTSGKAVSLDVMKVAKDALQSTSAEGDLDENLVGSFPWLQYVSIFSLFSPPHKLTCSQLPHTD